MAYKRESSGTVGCLLSVSAIMVVIGIVICVALWFQGYRFRQECAGYLSRAADAPTIEMAVTALDTAIEYAERTGKTSGNSGVIFDVPTNDVGYWYGQLKEARADLKEAAKDPSKTAQSNALMKLREVLTSAGEKGTYLSLPAHLSVYPNQVGWCVAEWVAGIFLVVGSAGCALTLSLKGGVR